MAANDPDYTLYQKLRKLPDFDCLVLPHSWYEKFKIPMPQAITPAEFINSGYSLRCAYAPKDLPPIRITEPQRDGFIYDVPKPEEIKVDEATVRMLEDAVTGGEQTAEVMPDQH
jgi:hypothetical protein